MHIIRLFDVQYDTHHEKIETAALCRIVKYASAMIKRRMMFRLPISLIRMKLRRDKEQAFKFHVSVSGFGTTHPHRNNEILKYSNTQILPIAYFGFFFSNCININLNIAFQIINAARKDLNYYNYRLAYVIFHIRCDKRFHDNVCHFV